MTTIETLKTHVDKLAALLGDPQPGLITWNGMVQSEWLAICMLREEVTYRESQQFRAIL